MLLKCELIRSHHDQLETGKAYICYGIRIYKEISVLVCNESSLIPYLYPITQFSVMDGRISKFWEIGPLLEVPGTTIRVVDLITANQGIYIAIPELSRLVYGYDNLINGSADAISAFQDRKQISDLEFLHPSVKNISYFDKNGWLQCFSCFNVWQGDLSLEMCRCPACEALARIAPAKK